MATPLLRSSFWSQLVPEKTLSKWLSSLLLLSYFPFFSPLLFICFYFFLSFLVLYIYIFFFPIYISSFRCYHRTTEPGTLWTGAGQDSLHSTFGTRNLNPWPLAAVVLLVLHLLRISVSVLCMSCTPSCSTPGPPKFLPLCTSCNSSLGRERAWAESKLCRFSILGCSWVRWTLLFLLVCVLGLVGGFLVGFGVFFGGIYLSF